MVQRETGQGARPSALRCSTPCNVDEWHRQEPQDCWGHAEICVSATIMSDGYVIYRVPIDCEFATE
jgi:hypothetical protein